MKLVYPSVDDVLSLHELLIDATGGSHGVRDHDLVEAAVARPQQTFGGQELYPTIFAKTAALFESLVNNHPFVDENKRTSALTAVTFMERNGWRVFASNAELVELTLAMATSSIGIAEATIWFEDQSEPV